MYYVISGWDCKGNQIVSVHYANSEAQAESMFLADTNGGEVNEVLVTLTDEEYNECV